MPGTPSRSVAPGRRIRLLPRDARRRRAATGGGAGRGRARRRQGHSRPRRRIRRPRLYRGRARPVLALDPGSDRRRRPARAGTLAAAAGEDQGRRTRHGRHARAPSHAGAVQRPRRDHGLLLRRPLRDPRAEAARLRRRHLLPRHADARLTSTSSRASPRRSASCGATRITPRRAEVLDAYRQVPGRVPERRGAHLPRHPARLHDAVGQGVRARARAFTMGRALAILDGLRGGGDQLRQAS